MAGDLLLMKPLSSATPGIQEIRLCRCGGIDVVKETSVDQLLRDNGLLAIALLEKILVVDRKLKLMFTKMCNFFEIVVAGIGARESHAFWCIDREVEFGCEFEVDELFRSKITNDEIEFANGGVDILLNLHALGEQMEVLRRLKDLGESVLVKVAEFLFEVQWLDFFGYTEEIQMHRFCFGEISDENRPVDKTPEEQVRCQGRIRVHVNLGEIRFQKLFRKLVATS